MTRREAKVRAHARNYGVGLDLGFSVVKEAMNDKNDVIVGNKWTDYDVRDYTIGVRWSVQQDPLSWFVTAPNKEPAMTNIKITIEEVENGYLIYVRTPEHCAHGADYRDVYVCEDLADLPKLVAALVAEYTAEEED